MRLHKVRSGSGGVGKSERWLMSCPLLRKKVQAKATGPAGGSAGGPRAHGPVGARTDLQGRSIVPLFKGSVKGWRTSFLSEYFEEPQNKRVPSWQAVRNDQWKYVRYTGLEGMDELYDLKKDSGEMKNLVHDAPGPLSALKKELDKYNEIVK